MRRVWHFCVLSFLISTCCMSTFESGGAAACNEADLAALRSVAASLVDWDLGWEWKTSRHDCCAWQGVGCSNNMRVTNLSIQVGTGNPVPVSVCGLSELIMLGLQGGGGSLWGSIPECICSNLTNLVELDLSHNSLTGSIPECIGSNLTNLILLDLSFNLLTGSIPKLSLSRLQTVILTDNSFSGPFPSSLILLPNLTSLHLFQNQFSGPLPSHFNFPLLRILALDYNSFSGSVPSFNAPFLTSLSLAGNSLSGDLSSLLGPLSTLPSLGLLYLHINALSGQIPTFDPSRFLSLSSLNLAENLLNGSLPHSLCGLSNLRHLYLDSNAFSGHFLQCKHPELNQLADLDASFNNFSGPFPEWIGSLSNLVSLDLSQNSFSGSLPQSWQNISSHSLQSLGLSGNSLIPQSLGAPRLPSWLLASTSIGQLSLSSMNLQDTDLSCSALLNNTILEDLDLSQNKLTSDVLRCINPSSQFTSLNLSRNPLSFSLNDAEMVKLLPNSVTSLDMSSCELTGNLSHHFLDHIAPYVGLFLAHNRLVGRIPAHLGNLSLLAALDLSHNFFTGFQPLLNKFSTLNTLLVSNNSLQGSFSSLFSNIFNTNDCDRITPGNALNILDLSHNRLSGVLPPFLGPCIGPNAERVKLNDNLLTGPIPNQFLHTSSDVLQALSLSNNQLSGPIPPSFKDFKSLELLDLGHNKLNGNLQAFFTNASFAHLRVLLLGYNDFTGSIPISLGDTAPALQLIDFSNNHLTGTIPVHTLQALPAFRIISKPLISGLTSRGTLYVDLRINVKGEDQSYVYVLEALTSLDLSGNNLSGPISIGLGELAGLVFLNLSRNNFSGLIPSDLGNLSRQLESLDLSFNVLEGPIPPSFRDLVNLAVFNVSYNKGLSGSIPNQPQFEMAASYIGDPNLCGEPTLRSCIKNHESPSFTIPRQENSSKFARYINEWISIPGLSLGIVVGFFGVLWILVLKDFFSFLKIL